VSPAAVAVAAVLLSPAQDGHWKGKQTGSEKAATVSFQVKRDGRFARTYKTGGGTYRISGTLRGRRVRDGHVSLQVSTCSGESDWTARRTGR
jgi:hypothetical protein